MASEEPGRWARVGAVFRRRWVLVTLGVLVVLFVAYTLAGFFLVPRLVASYVPRYVQEQLKRRAQIGEIRVNPLLLKVDIKNFRLTEADGSPLLGFDRLFVDLELAKSIIRAAWTFAEIRLETPRVDAVMFPDGRLNIADLLDAFPQGALDAKVRYDFAYRDGATSLKIDRVEVTATGLVLTERASTAPLLALDAVNVAGVSGDVVAQELTVPEIGVKRGRIAATLARDGTVNWQRLVTTPASPAPPAPKTAARPATAGETRPPAAETRPWRVAVEKVRVDEVALSVVDESRAAPLAVDVAGLNLGLSARLESGPLGLAGVADNLGVTLSRVAVRSESKTPLVALERIAVDGGRVDLGARQVAILRVAVNGGATTVERDASGAIPLLAALRPAEPREPARVTASRPPPAKAAPAAKARSTGNAPPTNAAPPEKPWSVAIDKLELADPRAGITDRGTTPAVELGLADLKASVRDVRTDGKKPWPFDASFRVVQGGRFTARGRVAHDGRTADAMLKLTQLALTPAQPYVARSADVGLRSGEVSSTGKLTYRAGAESPSVTYTGSADVERLVVMEADIADPVLAWKSLHAETIRFGLGADRLEIDEVRVGDLDGRR